MEHAEPSDRAGREPVDDPSTWPPGYRRGPERSPFEDLIDRENPVIEVIDWTSAQRLRSMSGVERVREFRGMMASAINVMRRGLRATHPAWNDERVDEELGRRMRGG